MRGPLYAEGIAHGAGIRSPRAIPVTFPVVPVGEEVQIGFETQLFRHLCVFVCSQLVIFFVWVPAQKIRPGVVFSWYVF